VTISDSGNNIIWQSSQSIDVGGQEIGYVDYTWSTEYDFEVPQIYDIGYYIMTVSWNDVTVEHKFQIREEIQFSFLQDMIPEYAHHEIFLSSFENDCSRKNTDYTSTLNTQIDNQQILDELEKSNLLLNLIFEKQEVWTNDEKRTREYIVPTPILECIENIKSGNLHLLEKLAQHGEKPEPDIQLLLRESGMLYHGHEYQQAIKTTDFILENLANDNPDAMVVKGKSLARLGQYEDAIETFENIVEINPNHVEGWFRLGHTLSNNNQHDMAIQSFDQAIKIDPKYADAYIGKAFTLMTLERYDDAVKSAEMAVQINPDIPAYREIYQTVLNISESR
jgi:tetratricopeptide (TPR) repeat protein